MIKVKFFIDDRYFCKYMSTWEETVLWEKVQSKTKYFMIKFKMQTQMGECVVNSNTCQFEDKNLCGYTLDDNGDYQWVWTQGSSPSSNKGPQTGDHTTNTETGHYMLAS